MLLALIPIAFFLCGDALESGADRQLEGSAGCAGVGVLSYRPDSFPMAFAMGMARISYTTSVAKKSWPVLVGEYTSLAFLLPVCTLVGYGIGYLLDKAFHTTWLYIPFLLLGIAAGLVQLIRQLMRDTRDDG